MNDRWERYIGGMVTQELIERISPEPEGPFGAMARNSCGIEKKRYRVAEMRLRGPALPTLDETIRVGHEVLQLSEEELDVELMMEELGK